MFAKIVFALCKQREGGAFKEPLDLKRLHEDAGQRTTFHGATEKFTKQIETTRKRVDDADPRLWQLSSVTLLKILSVMKATDMTLDEIIANFSFGFASKYHLRKPGQEEFRREFLEKHEEKS